MKFYSQKLRKIYDTEADLKKAEALVEKAEAEKLAKEKLKKEARATRAKEVEIALEQAAAARKKADELMNAFVKDYGYFHYSYKTEDKPATTATSFVDDFVKQVFSFLGEE